MSAAMSTFDSERDRLFGLAYRMLGSVSEAEDLLQESWIAWDELDETKVHNPAGFLTTLVTRRSVDRLRSAQHRREQYPGSWLPEPIIEELDPADSVVQAESLTLAFLGVLERLGPTERAVFLLHEVFEFPFAQVADATGQSEAACRKMASRARSRVNDSRPRYELPGETSQALLGALLVAVQAGDIECLLKLMDTDIQIQSDGGRKAPAAPKPIVGAERAARFMVGIAKKQQAAVVMLCPVNGEPGLVVFEADQLTTVMSFTFVRGKLTAVSVIRNPEKMRYVGKQLEDSDT